MKNYSIIIFIILSLTNICSAVYAQTQLNDDFNDGELSGWSGSTSHFMVNTSHQLQLNNTVAATSYITTSFAPNTTELEWSVYVRLAFAGSANNYGRIYLLSSQSNLTQPTEGYYLQLGEAGSNDAVELFRQNGAGSVSVCRAANATIAGAFVIRIKVLRNSEGLWKVMIDYAGGTNYTEAASGVDATYSTGSYFGILCVYTAGNANRFYYDDVFAGAPKPVGPPPDVANYNDVVINEVFPDPSPKIGLPELEFVEIYNRSAKTFDLDSWKIGDGSSLVSMPAIVLHPEEHVVITSVDGLPSLNNAGDVVKIVDDHGVLIDSISYTLDWYQDAAKSGGGYSIERLSVDAQSGDIANWYVSQDSTGGTPGRKNSLVGFTSHPVVWKDIIVTEIMADPAPVVQLPEAEYIEVFNRSADPIKFTGWHLEDATTSAKLPSFILMPGVYVLLTSTTNAARFPQLSNVVGVTSFPSLGNLGDRIVLREPGGVAIDSVAYTTSWYHNLEKSEGGWSLELIDVNNPCGEADNWTASENNDGGTPGKINSVFASKPDITPPKLLNLFATSPDSLMISFDEKLSETGIVSLKGVAYFSNLSKREVVYVLDQKLATGVLYEVTIADVRDCNGNLIEPLTTSLVLPEAAVPNDVVVNEVLFNPRPNGADFVELYNRSNKYINLKGWKLTDETIVDRNDILFPKSYRVFTSSSVATKTNYTLATSISEMDMPSLPDDEGTVTLTDGLGNVIDRFSYNHEMHSPILSDDEGVSLERISFEVPTDDLYNWHSANASAGFATPGYLNSNARPLPALDEGTVTISPEVIYPSGSAPFSQISYHFDRGGQVASVSVIDLDGRVIKTIASNETLGTQGSFQWNGDRDEGGLARCGYYVMWFQVFDLDGRVSTIRKRVVVGF